MRHTGPLTVWLLCAALISCTAQSSVDLRPTRLGLKELANASDRIVLATVEAVTPERQESVGVVPEKAGDQERRVRKVSVSATVIRNLKGSISPKQFWFWYYQWADGAYDGAPLADVRSGQTAIFFLRDHPRGLRATVDLFPFNIQTVDSQCNFENGMQPAEAIAACLLGPSDDWETFAKSLSVNAAKAIELVGLVQTLRRLERFATSTWPSVRRESCFFLAGLFIGADACLVQLGRAELTSESHSKRHAELNEQSREWRRAESGRLISEPERWYKSWLERFGPDGREWASEALKNLCSQDGRCRRSACRSGLPLSDQLRQSLNCPAEQGSMPLGTVRRGTRGNRLNGLCAPVFRCLAALEEG